MDRVRPSVPTEPAEVLRAAEAEMRAATLEERGRMVVRAVRAAVRIDRSRRASGFAEPVPEPWPASTHEFLRRHAAASRSGSAGERP